MPLQEQPPKSMHVRSVITAYTKASLRYPGRLCLIALAVIGSQTAVVTAPLYLRRFINILSAGVPSPATLHTLFLTLAFYGAVAIVGWLGRRVQGISTSRIESDVMADLEDTAFSSLIRQDHDFFTSNFTGSLTRRVTRYSRAYEQVFDALVQNFIPTFLFAAGSIAILWSRNHWLGIALLAWAVIFIAIQLAMTKWRQPLRLARATEDSRMTGALSDVISNHSAVSLYAAEEYEKESMSAIVKAWRRATRRSWVSDAWVQSIQDALAIIIEIGLLGGAVILWQRGLVTVGDFVLIQVYILGLIDRIWNIGNTLRRVYDAFADSSEMLEILERKVAITDARDAKPLALAGGAIALENISFSFVSERSVLENFSLAIEAGEKIGLVGPSGAGKSTVTRLLLRLYDPNAGAIRIDGQDLRDVTQESLRSQIAYVPQEPVLFHRSLKENIRYGKREATDEEIVEAAKLAHCHEFITQLPQGYDTLVGERGIKLSGGERQRVAIARAILKNAPILILDEATSSLDSESEALIQEALAKLMEGKTVIAIAHRLSTIMKMDRIIVMEAGKVILTGTHDELLSQGGNLYQKLWDIQAGGFIQDDQG